MVLPLAKLLPMRKIAVAIQESEKYLTIKASLRTVGLIEPLVVFPQKGRSDQYLLLDGAIRLDILRGLGVTEALCLVATEDETYTYNHKVNQVSPIQEHFMVLRAIAKGVPEEAIAATLNVDVAAIRRKRDLLVGVCPEAIALLKDKRVSPATLREIKRVIPLRQLEMAELMAAANDYSASYAKCLYAMTADGQRLASERPVDAAHGLPAEDVARMRRETENARRDYKVIEVTHGDNVLHLLVAVGYIKKLLANARVVRFLTQHHADVGGEFRKLVDAPDLDIAAAPS
ncbi:MAG: RepB partitioning protein / ParB-like protein [Phycisphaerales bacterium]|nr:RepB partitioning protein / ParB-like protein [Phycisphaerales bacterium]